MRRLPAVLAASGLALALAACAPSAGACEPTTNGTGAVDVLAVVGAFGEDVTVMDISTLFAEIPTTERHVSMDGDTGSMPAVAGATVELYYAFFDGTTGEPIVSATSATGPETWVLGDELPLGVNKVLTCAVPNSRVVGIIPASEGFHQPPTGFPADVPLIFVADVVSVAG